MAEQTATLTHKVRNPQNLESWLNIWEANVSANYDDNNNRNDESIIIKPSENWQIPFDNIQWPSTESTTNLLRSDGQWVDTSNLINWTQELSTQQNSVIYSFIEQDTKKRTISEYRAKLKGLGKIKFQYDPNDFPSVSSTTETDANGENYISEKTFLPSVNISLDPLETEDIADEAITSEKIADNSITSEKIADEAITSEKIADEAITSEKIKNNTIKLEDLDLTTSSSGNPDNPDFKLLAKNIGDIPATQITNLDAAVNQAVKTNTKNDAGVVIAGNGHNSEVWSTDSEGNPAWTKIEANHLETNLNLNDKLQDASVSGSKLDTRLLGVWINDMQPTNINVESYNQLDTTQMKKRYSQSFRVQKTGQTLEPYYVVSSNNSYFELAQQNDDFSKIILKQYFISSFNCRISDDGTYYDVSIYYNTATLKTFNITDILPDLTYLGDLYKSAFNDFYNSTIAETNSNYISSNDYFSIRLNAQNKIMNDYINTLDSSSEHKTTAIDYTFGSNLLNNWDYEHCGIWIEI